MGCHRSGREGIRQQKVRKESGLRDSRQKKCASMPPFIYTHSSVPWPFLSWMYHRDTHCEGLSAPRLPICKDADVVPVHSALNQMLGVVKDLVLVLGRVEDLQNGLARSFRNQQLAHRAMCHRLEGGGITMDTFGSHAPGRSYTPGASSRPSTSE